MLDPMNVRSRQLLILKRRVLPTRPASRLWRLVGLWYVRPNYSSLHFVQLNSLITTSLLRSFAVLYLTQEPLQTLLPNQVRHGLRALFAFND
jgi:hypothetical protein